VHATEKLAHAELIVNRIVQLGGTPVLHPAEWEKKARCAIKRYEEIATLTAGKDHITHSIAVQILTDELEHEQDIEDWINDINRMREDFKKLRM